VNNNNSQLINAKNFSKTSANTTNTSKKKTQCDSTGNLLMLNSMQLMNINDSPASNFKTINQKESNNITNNNEASKTDKREVMSNFNSTKNKKFMQNISHKNLFKQQINDKINSCDFNANLDFGMNNNNVNINYVNSNNNNYNAILETNNMNNTEGNLVNNNINQKNNISKIFNSTTKNQIHTKKITDIPLLSSLNFNKTQKKTEFNSENTIKPCNLALHQNFLKSLYNHQTNNPNVSNINKNTNNIDKKSANNKITKSPYLNSLNANGKLFIKNSNAFIHNYKIDEAEGNKLNINLNNLDHLQLKKLGQFSVPISKITSKKNSQNNSKSISRLDENDHKVINNNNHNIFNNNHSNFISINNNNNYISNINRIDQKEEIEPEIKKKIVKVEKINSQLMGKFLPITTSNSPKQLLNKHLLKNINLKKENDELKSINNTTSFKNKDQCKNNKNNDSEKVTSSNHKFFLDFNKLKEMKKNPKGNALCTESFEYEEETKSKILLETSNESIRSTLRESVYYRKEAERLSIYIKNCKCLISEKENFDEISNFF